MLKKIISGGQTGADRAALDVALQLGIPHGGWIPNGRRTEDGPLPEKYMLQEMPTASYPKRTEKNVLDSDGTLIISHGPLRGGSKLTRDIAQRYGLPVLHIDLFREIAFQAAQHIKNWILENGIEILNVAGPRQSHDPNIYQATYDILETALYLDVIDAPMPPPIKPQNTGELRSVMDESIPVDVRQAVQTLMGQLTFQEKTRLANMAENKLQELDRTLGQTINRQFHLLTINDRLLQSCREQAGDDALPPEEAAMIIIKTLWRQLQGHRNLIRRVK